MNLSRFLHESLLRKPCPDFISQLTGSSSLLTEEDSAPNSYRISFSPLTFYNDCASISCVAQKHAYHPAVLYNQALVVIVRRIYTTSTGEGQYTETTTNSI
jgi:hypothetical protein